MTADSARIIADLERHARAFDMTEDKLGESLCAAFTNGVATSIAAQQAPDGTPWADLSEAYAEQKSRSYPGKPIGVRLGLMAASDEVAGDVIVLAPETAMVTYGVTPEARDEAAWFQRGDPGQNRPARPFWGMTPAAESETQRILAERLKSVIS